MPYDESTQIDYGKNPLSKKSGFKMKYKRSAFPFGGAVNNNLSGVNTDVARQAMQNNKETSQITNQSWMGGDWWNKQD